jgi:hypothetical protein
VKIVEATWEKRNLGVTCVEATVEPADTAAELRRRLAEISAQYNVVKVPAGRADAMLCVSELGYAFIEASIHVTWKVVPVELPAIQKRMADSTGHALMDDADKEVLWSELRRGIHDTDRVSLDPRFGKQRAGERYVGWIQDELARGTDIYKLTYKGQTIGYFTMKHLGDGVYYPFLGGMYESHRNSGLGIIVPYKPMCEVAARGGRSISTYISTNNEPAIRVHVSLGFSFGQVTYVYVKHS